MNTKLTIKNFRVFDEDGVTVDLKPITVLTGCNSSGKSSVMKAALMLEQFLKDYYTHFSKSKFEFLGSPATFVERLRRGLNDLKIDFTLFPNNLLGRVDKILHNGSASNTFSFEYTISPLQFSKTFSVKIVFCKNEEEKLGNAHLKDLEISTDDGVIFSLEKSSFNFSILANIFFDFIVNRNQLVSLYNKYGVSFPCEYQNRERIRRDREYVSNAYLQNLDRYAGNDASILDSYYKIFDHDLSVFANAIDNEILLYSPVLHKLDDVDKKVFQKYAEDYLYKDCLYTTIDNKNKTFDIPVGNIVASKKIVDEFIQSEFDCFSDFYRYYENNYLESYSDFSNYPVNNNDDKNKLLFHDIFSVVAVWSVMLCPEWEKTYNAEVSQLGLSFLFPEAKPNVSFVHKMEKVLFDIAKDIIWDCFTNSEIYYFSFAYINSNRTAIKRLYKLDEISDLVFVIKKLFDQEQSFLLEDRLEFVNKWIRAFGIGNSLNILFDEEGLGVQIRLHKTAEDKEGRLLADEGYGITQLVSILLQIVACRAGTIYIEEPEIHLHPKLQSLLADMFVDASQFDLGGKHFIIETHSEYLIRRLQVLVAEKKLDKKNVSIAYIYSKEEAEKENQPRVKNIAICEDGYLDDTFGSGFFDEATSLSRKLM